MEDGLNVIDAGGVASGTVHTAVEPLVAQILPELEAPVHDLNCQLVVPLEDAVDDLLTPLLP